MTYGNRFWSQESGEGRPSEPVEVRVNPDGIDIVSYPGPMPSIRTDALNADKIVACRYRDRRIGKFLKELELTEGRYTGIPTTRRAMSENGSPLPRLSTDEGRTYLSRGTSRPSVLPGLERAHEGAHDWAHVELLETESEILIYLATGPKSRSEIAHLGVDTPRRDHLLRAIERLLRFLRLVELTIPGKRKLASQGMCVAVVGDWTLGPTCRSVSLRSVTPSENEKRKRKTKCDLCGHGTCTHRSGVELCRSPAAD